MCSSDLPPRRVHDRRVRSPKKRNATTRAAAAARRSAAGRAYWDDIAPSWEKEIFNVLGEVLNGDGKKLEVKERWPEAELRFVHAAGHDASEPELMTALTQACEDMKKRRRG